MEYFKTLMSHFEIKSDNYAKPDLHECERCGTFKQEQDFPNGDVICEDCIDTSFKDDKAYDEMQANQELQEARWLDDSEG